MRNLKTVVALVVALTMMLGTVAFAAFEDVEGTNVEEAVTTLTALDIISGYEDGTFGPEKTITRAEFAAVVTRALGLSDSGAQKTATQFSDVPEEHWASGYVSLAASMGIIVGHGDGTFGPDDEVTYEQAIKMLVTALGYEPAAVASGGYPTGYMVIASTERITRGATGTPGQPALRGVVAQLTYNALDVVLMEQTGFGRDPIYEKNSDGRTLLSDKLDVMKIYGTVTANEYSTLTSSTSSSRESEVTINYYDEDSTASLDSDGYNTKVTANVGNTDAADFLGYKVIAYVREDNLGRNRTVVAIMEDSDEIEKLTIDAYNIENVDDSNSNKISLEYWVDKERDYDPETIDIEKNPSVIYNGKARTSDKIDALEPSSGELVLVDTNRDDVYDVVFVKEYDYYIVDYTDASVQTVFSKNQPLSGYSSIELDPDKDREYKFNLEKDGEPIELEDLNEWDILAVAADRPNVSGVGSNRAELINITVLNDTVEGRVTEYFEDNGVEEYFINGQKYEANANAYLAGVGLDSEGVFFLDLDGRIVYADTSMRASRNYAYLIETDVDEVFGSYTAQFRVLTADGDVVIYNGANNIRYTDSEGNQNSFRQSGTGLTHEDLINGYDDDGTQVDPLAENQLITMQLSTAGEITRIESARDNATDLAFSKYAESDANNKMVYRNGYMDRNYIVDEDTIVFEVPDNVDYEKYSVRNGNIFSDNKGYVATLFDVADDGHVAVMTLKEREMGFGSGVALVDRITLSTNDDGYTVNGIYAMQDGEWINMIDDGNALTEKNVKPGDAILFETNAKGEIDDVMVLVSPNTATESFEKWDNEDTYEAYAELYTAYGEVIRRQSGSIMLDIDGEEVRFSTRDAVVYRYDFTRSSNKAAVTSVGEIKQQTTRTEDGEQITVPGDKVFVRMNDSEVESIILYQNLPAAQ